ncbi:MAG: hypothetical protein JSW00_04335 [Thermoplasmata archaeon]|nr:MAG: hypothetical protein JSW00_04335 [Thermoplasmata archaeon]
MYNDSSVDIGDYYFDSNIINAGRYGIYFETDVFGSYLYDNAQVTSGDIIITNNNVNSSNHGIYLLRTFCGEVMYGLSTTSFGNVIIDNNDLFSGGNGIYLYMNHDGIFMLNDACMTMGYFNMNSNNITSQLDGIYISIADMVNALYNNTLFSLGDFTISYNTINSTTSAGISFRLMDIAKDMAGNATATFGNFLFINNNITAFDDGILLVVDDIGFNMRDSAVLTMKDFILNDNILECGPSSDVIDSVFTNIGGSTQGDSFITLGNWNIEDNTILSGYYGIHVWSENWGYDMADNSNLMYGNFFIINNVVNVTGNRGIGIDFMKNGLNMADSSSVTGGNMSIINNIVSSRDQFGLLLWYDQIGYNLYNFSYVSTGWIDISYNNFSSINNYGAYLSMYRLGYNMDGNSQAYIGGIMFTNNNVWSDTMDALHFYQFYQIAYQMYNDSYVQIGNVLVNDNYFNASGTGDGIELFQWTQNAYEMSHNASANFGNFEFNHNTITAGDGGIIMSNMGYWGNYLRGDNQVTFGHFFLNDNIINNSNGYGIDFGDWYDMGKQIYGQSVFTMGDFEIAGNSISTIGFYGIYIYMDSWAWRVYDNAEVHFGNFLFSDNIVNSTGHGININAILYWGSDVHNNSLATFGNIEVNRNEIIAGSIPSGFYKGIYFLFYENGYEMFGNSSVNLGHIQLNDNNITCDDSHGIYINAYELAYTMTGTASATFGDLSVSNNIIESQNQGIYCQFEYAGYDMHDMSTFEMGSIIVLNNTITSGQDPASVDSYGILFLTQYVGYEMYNESQAIVGPILVNDNTVTVIFGTGTHANGIHINWISNYGANMYDTATFTMNGNIEVCRNTVNTTDGDEGIFCDIYNLGNYLYGENTASYGNFLFNDNTIIEAYNDGMRIEIGEIGYYTLGNSSVTMGSIQLNDNDVLLFNGGYYAGIELYLDKLGSSMYDGSIFNMGHVQMNDNIIYCVNGLGFEVSAYWLGYQMYNGSSAHFGDFEFLRNNITSKDWGIRFASFHDLAADLHNDSMVFFGNFLINNNVINTTDLGSDGISFDQPRYVGYQMYDQSHAELGYFEFNGNEIIVGSLADGIDFQPYNWAYYMYDSATFTIGDFSFIGNTITAGNNGIYFQPTYFGSYMYGNSSAHFGKNEIMHNTLNSTGGSGIESWWWENFGSHIYDYSYFEVGSCYIMFNNITSWSPTHYGIYTGPYYSGNYVSDESQAHFGDYIVSNNNIFSNGSYGIYFYYEGIGFYLDVLGLSECRAVVEVGEIRLESNIITVPQGTGIYFYGYDVAEELMDFASVNATGISIANNTITAFDYGIYFGMEYFGYNLWNESQANMGPVVIEKNNITCTNGTGIKCYIIDNAYNIHNDSRLSIEDIHLKQNTITASITGIDIVLDRCINIMDNSTVVFPGMMIVDNLVDSAFSAFNYTTVDTPRGVTGTPTLLVGDVIIQGNTFDGGLFGMLFEWQNPDPTVQQPVFHINECDIIGGSAGSKGLLLFNITDVFATQLTIDTFDYGIYSNNSVVHHMLNGSIANCAVLDISLYSASYLFMINSTFNNASVFFEDYDSLLEVAWFMNVLVQSQVALPVPEAIVAVADVDKTEIFNSTANSDGQAFFIICMEYQENITGIIKNFNDYTANATKSGAFGVATPNPTMDHTQLVIITLIDNIPPTIFSDNSDTSGTTGDPFYFEINASDNMGIVSVHVNYRPEGVVMYKNLTMNGTGPYWLYEDMLSDYVGLIEYYFTAVDSGGFWVNTTPTTVPITDNDAPTFVWVSQPMGGTTGEFVLVSIQATDNIGITYYKIDVDGMLYDLDKDGDYYNFTIDIPPDSITDIIYSIILNDSANNPNTIPGTTITVTDNDEPTYTWVLQPTTGLAGGTFTVSLIGTDNIGVTNYTITINGTTFDMVKDGDYYNYTFNIPIESTEDIPYNVTFKDNEGNSITTEDTVLTITSTDDEKPTYTWVLRPTTGTTGEHVLISLLATDNTGITYYRIIIDGALHEMSRDGDYYNYTLNIPSDSTASITYNITFSDWWGNDNITDDTTITVTDDDSPSYTWVLHPSTGTAGESVLVSLTALDNIGVTYYKINIDGTTYDMIKDGDYFNYTINIPPGSSASITYDVTFKDAAGNPITTDDTVITVTLPTDSEQPEFDWVLHPNAGTTGDSLLVSLHATDNVGITYYKISIDGTLYDLVKDGDYYNYTIHIPSDSLASITYFVVFNDSANNPNTATSTVITVTDDDPGSISNPASDTSGEKGKEFRFQIDVSDNIGVSEVKVWYWFGDDESKKKPLTLEESEGTYSGSITPEESGTLHYYFEVTDTAGNPFISDDYSVTIGTAEKEDEEEMNVLPFIIIVVIIIIVILLFLLTRKKKEAEEIPEVEEGLAEGEEEVAGEEAPEEIEEIEESYGEEEVEEELVGEEGYEEIEEPLEEEVIEEEVYDEDLRPEEEIVTEELDDEGPTELDDEPEGKTEEIEDTENREL